MYMFGRLMHHEWRTTFVGKNSLVLWTTFLFSDEIWPKFRNFRLFSKKLWAEFLKIPRLNLFCAWKRPQSFFFHSLFFHSCFVLGNVLNVLLLLNLFPEFTTEKNSIFMLLNCNIWFFIYTFLSFGVFLVVVLQVVHLIVVLLPIPQMQIWQLKMQMLVQVI